MSSILELVLVIAGKKVYIYYIILTSQVASLINLIFLEIASVQTLENEYDYFDNSHLEVHSVVIHYIKVNNLQTTSYC